MEAVPGAACAEVARGVRLLDPAAVRGEDLVLVAAALADAGDEQFPHSAGAERAHRVCSAVPVVEVADQAHGTGIRRPHRERRTGHRAPTALVLAHPGPEHLPQLLVPALADQVQVEFAEGGQEAVGIVVGVHVGAVVDAHPVIGHDRARQPACEHPLALVREFRQRLARRRGQPHLVGERPQHPHGHALGGRVRAEQRVRIAEVSRGEPLEVGGGQGRWALCGGHDCEVPSVSMWATRCRGSRRT